ASPARSAASSRASRTRSRKQWRKASGASCCPVTLLLEPAIVATQLLLLATVCCAYKTKYRAKYETAQDAHLWLAASERARLALGHPPSTPPPRAREDAQGRDEDQALRLRHIVVIYREDRSFDNLRALVATPLPQ